MTELQELRIILLARLLGSKSETISAHRTDRKQIIAQYCHTVAKAYAFAEAGLEAVWLGQRMYWVKFDGRRKRGVHYAHEMDYRSSDGFLRVGDRKCASKIVLPDYYMNLYMNLCIARRKPERQRI